MPALVDADLTVIKPGKAKPHGPIAILAPGTGLGEAYLFWDGQRYRPIPSEGGHTDFAPVDEEQLALLVRMRKKRQQVSYEMLIAGPGLAVAAPAAA